MSVTTQHEQHQNLCVNWKYMAMSNGENSQMIKAKSSIGQNTFPFDSTTFTNLHKIMLIQASYFAGINGPILFSLLYYLGYQVSCCVKEMPNYSSSTKIKMYLSSTIVRDPGFGRVYLPSSVCGFHFWVQSLCHFHPMVRERGGGNRNSACQFFLRAHPGIRIYDLCSPILISRT